MKPHLGDYPADLVMPIDKEMVAHGSGEPRRTRDRGIVARTPAAIIAGLIGIAIGLGIVMVMVTLWLALSIIAASIPKASEADDRIVVLNFTCRDLKKAARQFGRDALLAKGKEYGLSAQDLAAVKQCLRS